MNLLLLSQIQLNQLHLNYDLQNVGVVTEILTFPEFEMELFLAREESIVKACDLLHWLCGVSYYKAGLAKLIKFSKNLPSEQAAQFLEKTWINGLGELAFENSVSLDIRFPYDKNSKPCAQKYNLTNRSLLPFGGGKDSFVSMEHLKFIGKDFDLFMLGNAELIKNQAKELNLKLVQVQRKIDPKLIEYNQVGAFNGHVPITSINSACAMLTALLLDYDAVIFSNERSADSANVTLNNDVEVNHQYSKSFEFELSFSELFKNEITPSIQYYSLPRPNSELQSLRSFSKHAKYFKLFSSCNRNFHLQGTRNTSSLWCGDCPKCRFTFLGLAPFVQKQQLVEVFSKNLLNDEFQIKGYQELLGLSGFKPFECVGEIEESQIALQMIATNSTWSECNLVKYFRDRIPVHSIDIVNKMFAAADVHQIPKEYLL